MRETISEQERHGQIIKVDRTEEEDWTQSERDQEYLISIDGTVLVSFQALEMDGWDGPWEKKLTRYAEAFIDGLHEKYLRCDH